MLSVNYKIDEFVRMLSDRDEFETVWLAHKEIMHVERRLLAPSMEDGLQKERMTRYVKDLKALVSSIRYAAVPRKIALEGWMMLYRERFSPILPKGNGERRSCSFL